MAERFDSWDDVTAFALALPDVELAPFYGTPCPLLVRYGSADPERVANIIRRAWWDRAKKPQRTAFGPRP